MADARTTTIPDAKTAPEAPLSPTHVAIRREDYRPPDWLVPELRLDFDLGLERTRVRATLEVVRNGDHARPLRLDGDEVELISVMIDGRAAEHRLEGAQLVNDVQGDRATIENDPRNPTRIVTIRGLGYKFDQSR